MRILVTGSAGFIGFHLSQRLLDKGHEVFGIDAMVPYYDVRLKERRHALLARSPAFRCAIVNIAERDALRDAFAEAKPEVVIHLAAQAGVRYALEHPETYVESNMVGTANLLELVRHNPVRHLLFASTSSAYGANEAMPFRETDRAVTPLTIYSASKIAGEMMAHSYAHLWNQPITTFRFFSVYGPWGRPDMALFKFTDRIIRGEPIDIYNNGEMLRDFTYVADLVEAIIRLMDTVPVRGAPVSAADSLSPVAPYRLVNIGTGAPIRLMDFIAEIERCVGRPMIPNFMPMQPGDVVATFASTELLQKLTGFAPVTSCADGVAAFVAWFREYYAV